MSLWDRIYRGKKKVVANAEPNRIYTVGIDDIKAEVHDNR